MPRRPVRSARVTFVALVAIAAACGAPARALDASGVDTPDAAPASGADAGVGARPDASVDPLSAEELVRITRVLTSDELAGRDEGTAGGLAARAFLTAELERCGLEPLAASGYAQPIDGSLGANLLARIPGASSTLGARTVLLSAHYDHLGPCGGGICRGAVDNAAGVAVVVAVACTLRSLTPARSVIIALWDAEEPPTFLTPRMGSRFYVDNPVAPLEDLDVAIVLDLIGGNLWPEFPGHFVLGAETAAAVNRTLRSIAPPAGLSLFGIGLHVAEEWPDGHQAWSDYDAFRNSRIPTILLSDGQNRDYHTPADDLSNVDVAKLTREAAYVLDLVTALANADETPVFQSGADDHLSDADAVLRLIDAALAPGGLVDHLATLPETRPRLERDRATLASARAQLAANGGRAGPEALTAIRVGAQRILCLAGNTYPEATCTFF
ncbi:M28 family peptidase [Myxococcota bacterium]|nr:M28 family peptidase [Myxococcota bacterium]